MPIVNLVGAFFRPPAKFLLQVLPSGAPLELRPEPENPYDPQAIAVWGSAAAAPEGGLESIQENLEGCGHGLPEDEEELALWKAELRHLGYVAKEQTASVFASAASAAAPWHARLTFSAEGKPQVKFNFEENI